MKKGQFLIIGLVVAVIAAFFIFDLGAYLSFESIKAQQANWQSKVTANPFLSAFIFFIIYVVLIAFSIPGAALLTLLAGGLFGLVQGTLIVSFASTIGATLAFLGARYLFRDSVQQKFGERLSTINQGVKDEGAFYLFGLRLVPVFPFFLINLLMAVTPIKTWVFYLASQIGMLPGTLVYVNAGTQLSKLDSPAGILSPSIIISFALLAAFPFIAKKILPLMRSGHEKIQ